MKPDFGLSPQVPREAGTSSLVKPRALAKGGLIGLAAPASPCRVEGAVEAGRAFLESLGFRVKLGASCLKARGYLAGGDEERAEDLNRFFADPDVDAVFCLRGGYGSLRLLDRLDLGTIGKNPKIFLGYSDVTVLHAVFNRLCGFVTFHGPMVASDMGEGLDGFSREALLGAVGDPSSAAKAANPAGRDLVPLSGGRAEGPLCGGNLTLLASTLGTPYEIETRGKILFLEDVDLEPYEADRLLVQLRLAGKLEECAGFLLGDWRNCESKGTYPDSPSLGEVLRETLLPLRKPVLAGISAGHCRPQLTLPLGAKTFVDAERKAWGPLESGVR